MKNQVPLSEIEWTLIWMAIRYAMDRETIASATLPEMIIRAYYRRLSDGEKESTCRDLKEHFEQKGKFGNPDIDTRHWMKFWKCLETSSHVNIKGADTEITCFQVGERYYPLSEYIRYPNFEIYLLPEDLDKKR
jgi:hypothetical protein